jgi:SEC-C motif-containing protein
MAKKSAVTACPCGNNNYQQCCARFIESGEIPSTAEALMRSRYSAFALQKIDYLKATWHPDTLPPDLDDQDPVQWIGLSIIDHQHEPNSDRATVEFTARFKVAGRAHRFHEVSNFVRYLDAANQLRWFYVDGLFPEDPA